MSSSITVGLRCESPIAIGWLDGGHDADGVGRPEFEAWVFVVDVEYEGGAVPEMGTYGGWMSIVVNGTIDCEVVPQSASGWEREERA